MGGTEGLEAEEARAARKTYKCLLPVILQRKKGSEPVPTMGLVDSGNCWRTAISPEVAERLGYKEPDFEPIQDNVKLCTADETQALTVLGQLPQAIRFTTKEGKMAWRLKPVVIRGLAGGLKPTSERRRGMCQIRPQGAEGREPDEAAAGSGGRHHRGARPKHQDSAPPGGLEDQGLEG